MTKNGFIALFVCTLSCWMPNVLAVSSFSAIPVKQAAAVQKQPATVSPVRDARPETAAANAPLTARVAESSLHTDGKPDWAATAHQDLLQLNPHLPPPEAQQTITEKRATAARPIGSASPDQSSLNAQRIFLAGDWLHPRSPATLEAAVQSGEAAAQALLARRQ